MKKKLKLKSWVKWLILILAILGTLILIAKTNDDFIKDCVNSGYSEAYCRNQI